MIICLEELLSFQGVSKLFATAYETDDIKRNANTQESRRRYYLVKEL